jgi:hypothetical protein
MCSREGADGGSRARGAFLSQMVIFGFFVFRKMVKKTFRLSLKITQSN